MPSDFIIEYRERFLSYHSRTQAALWQFDTGRSETPDLSFQSAEYSDLWSAPSIETLNLEQERAFLEIERREAILLKGFAWTQKLAAQLAGLSREIAFAEDSLRVSWDGNVISVPEAVNLANLEPSPLRRQGLNLRILEILRTTEDLRLERLESIRHGETGTHLETGELMRGFSPSSIATMAEPFLGQTQGPYRAALSSFLPFRASVPLIEAAVSDLDYALATQDLDQHFPAWKIDAALRETFAGMGILTYRQQGLRIEATARENAGARVFPVSIPDDIRLLLPASPGVSGLEAALRKSVEAQRFLWVSENLTPPLRRLGDASVSKGFQLLFSSLASDGKWLEEICRYRESEKLRQRMAIKRAFQARKTAGETIFESEFFAGLPVDQAESRYSELIEEAAGAKAGAGVYPRSLSDDFRAAVEFRAIAFETQLREHLKVRYGSKWWQSRKAGEFLVEIWNTGGKYQLEELSKLTDVGEVSYDWLADDIVRGLKQ